MRIAFRVDASLVIGSGHVMRCLTLADEMRSRGSHPLFLCRELPGDLISFIESRGYPVVRLKIAEDLCWEEDARQCTSALLADGGVEWLVVDSYNLDASWESLLRSAARRLFVIDDLADRPHDCDVLLDQNYYLDAATRYDGLTPAHCRTLIGPAFTLLRGEFQATRTKLRERDGHIRRILVFFGGSDLGNETLKTVQAIDTLNQPAIAVDVIIGQQNPHRNDLESYASILPGVTTHFNVSNMAEMVAAADLYVGAAGTTTWERCCLGLPSLVITVAANQVQATRDLDQLGVLTFLGDSSSVTSEQIAAAIRDCMSAPERMKSQANKGLQLVDGRGALRCVEAFNLRS
jgi:UDP-2,4-diacetamido-2,4,6-trideoxy-beta-L-altropyranose hydrolase